MKSRKDKIAKKASAITGYSPEQMRECLDMIWIDDTYNDEWYEENLVSSANIASALNISPQLVIEQTHARERSPNK